MRVRDLAMHRLGVGTMRSMASVFSGIYTFDHSAHSPIFEEPERSRLLLRQDVLQRRTGHSDIAAASG